MYFAHRYQSHNESLKSFISQFNKVSKRMGKRIVMQFNEIENYIDDGKIINTETGQEICFDWEKRHSYYYKCGFPFPSFGQFERKIKKPEILLSIQCSKDEKCFVVAWHEDFKKENKEYIRSATSNGYESNAKRFTKKFKEFQYSEMEKFYKILEKAFETQKFNSSVFSIVT